jgi:hypothetical protein
MKTISNGKEDGTCLPVHYQCGWPSTSQQSSKLPTFVLSVGLEGAGHHLWTEILEHPVHDCVWINSRQYDRDIGDGIPKTSVPRLHDAIIEQFKLREQVGKPPCRYIYGQRNRASFINALYLVKI